MAQGCKMDPIFSAQADKEKLEKLLESAKQEVLEMLIQSYHGDKSKPLNVDGLKLWMCLLFVSNHNQLYIEMIILIHAMPL